MNDTDAPVPHAVRVAARDAADTVLPALLHDLAAGQLVRAALRIAADEAVDAAYPLIEAKARAAERERIRRQLDALAHALATDDTSGWPVYAREERWNDIKAVRRTLVLIKARGLLDGDTR
jgi:hypothetical protein